MFKRNSESKQSNKRPMSVPNMKFSVSQDNKRVLEMLDEKEKKKEKKEKN